MAYKVPFVNYPKQYGNMGIGIGAIIKEVLLNGDFILLKIPYLVPSTTEAGACRHPVGTEKPVRDQSYSA